MTCHYFVCLHIPCNSEIDMCHIQLSHKENSLVSLGDFIVHYYCCLMSIKLIKRVGIKDIQMVCSLCNQRHISSGLAAN